MNLSSSKSNSREGSESRSSNQSAVQVANQNNEQLTRQQQVLGFWNLFSSLIVLILFFYFINKFLFTSTFKDYFHLDIM